MAKLTALEHLRACAMNSKKYVLSLIGDIAGTVAEALEEMDQVKADKAAAVSATIPKTGWGSDSTAGYPKYYDITVAGITAKDRAEITIARDSFAAARACGLCQTNETQDGKIRIRAASVPEMAIVVEYWIEEGKG